MSDVIVGIGLGLATVLAWLRWEHVKRQAERRRIEAMMAFYRAQWESEVDDE